MNKLIKESQLIFIISQPRSGSTMLQKIISNNDHVDTVSEPWLLLPFLSIYKPELIEATYNYDVMAKGVKDYLSKKKLEDNFYLKLKELIFSLYQVENEGQYFLDKTPRYYEILPEIFNLFPNARYLVLKRNPFASLNSMLRTWSGGKIKLERLLTFYRDFLVAPFKIQAFVDEHLDKPNVQYIKYEDLVSSQEVNVQKLYDWLSIPYNDTVLNFASNRKVTGIYGDDVYKKTVTNEISKESTFSWIDKCKYEPIKGFFIDYNNYLTEDFLKKYGYEPLNWNKSLIKRNKLFNKLISQPRINLKF